jgi:hypothetical protein
MKKLLLAVIALGIVLFLVGCPPAQPPAEQPDNGGAAVTDENGNGGGDVATDENGDMTGDTGGDGEETDMPDEEAGDTENEGGDEADDEGGGEDGPK